MDIDKTTLNDLAVFQHDEESSIFHKLNFTRTTGGRERLRQIFNTSLKDINSIQNVQKTLQLILEKKHEWPLIISNGSIMVIHKFFETILDQMPARPTPSAAYFYKIFHAPDYSLAKYSAGHAFDFIKGMQQIIAVFYKEDAPANMKKLLLKASILLQKNNVEIIAKKEKFTNLSITEMLRLAYYVRYHFRQNLEELIDIYFQLDAWYAMAMATDTYQLTFPSFKETAKPELTVKKLYHVLLNDPVAYDLELSEANNFIFLTGANMGGKSTFIKAVGGAVFLAHIGMGVPAKEMELSLFDGLLSNINVEDNIVKGESYFFNEVQRIKKTIIKITDGRKWLILIDELFKGTNVQDAMKCSTVVIEGLIKIQSSLFILSTHLYEIGEALKKYPNINFKFFETTIEDEKLSFNYNLKDGISNDRIGYLILKREKVIELLEKL